MATNNSTAPTPEQFQASFPNPAIPKIEGKPDYESLDALRSLLVENAASVSTTLGGGLFGHSGMVLSPAAYELVAPDTPYVPPPNPGPEFVAPDENLTGPVIAGLERQHTRAHIDVAYLWLAFLGYWYKATKSTN